MALNLTASKIVAPVAAKAPKAAAPAVAPVAKRPRAVTNGNSARQMLTWTPNDNKFFETLSYLPPLTEEEIALQVRYIVGSGWTPCLEFADSQHAYVSDDFTVRMSNSVNYFDNRYWTMWKLPMFGCTDPSQVQHEIDLCVRTFPDSFIRIVGFDSVRQVQSAGFLVHRPPQVSDYRAPDQRSVGGAYGGGYGGGAGYGGSSPPPMDGYGGQGPQSGGYRRSAY